MLLDEYLTKALLIEFDGLDGPVYYRSVAGGGEGYIVIWPGADDELPAYHHTYHFPPDVWGINA